MPMLSSAVILVVLASLGGADESRPNREVALMRLILLVLGAAALMAAMVVVMAMPAFANPNGPGPNSIEAELAGSGQNYGHCVAPGAPNSGEDVSQSSPALYQGQTTDVPAYAVCSKL